jgi:serine phosphatase RsbU (regulator of sigma subunit)
MSRISLIEKLLKNTHDVLESSLKATTNLTQLALMQLDPLADLVEDLNVTTKRYEEAVTALKVSKEDKREEARTRVAQLERLLADREAEFLSGIAQYETSLQNLEQASNSIRSSFVSYRTANQRFRSAVQHAPIEDD